MRCGDAMAQEPVKKGTAGRELCEECGARERMCVYGGTFCERERIHIENKGRMSAMERCMEEWEEHLEGVRKLSWV